MFTQIKTYIGVLFLAMMALVALPIVVSAEEMELDPNVSAFSATPTGTDVGATVDYDFTITTAEALEAGQSLYIVFLIQSDVQPTEIGTSFESANFTTTDSISALISSLEDHNHAIGILGLTEDLAAGTYNFVLEDVVNPSDDYTIYPAITTETPGESAAYTMGSGINIGEGSEENGEGSGEGAGPSCEEEIDHNDVPEIENISVTAIGEYVRIRWDAQEDTDSYVVSITEDAEYQDLETLQTGIEDTMYEFEADPETTYYIDMRGDDENNCQSAHGQTSVTTAVALSETRAKKAEFLFPKKKRKQKKFNIKFAVEDPEDVFRVEYQVFKGKKAANAKHIFKKKRYKKTKKKLKAVTVKGKKIEAGTYYHVRMRKVYKIGDELVRTKYSKKKRVRTKQAVVEATM